MAFLQVGRRMFSSFGGKGGPVVAIAGVTGAVGQELLELIESRGFKYSELRPLASKRSAGIWARSKFEKRSSIAR